MPKFAAMAMAAAFAGAAFIGPVQAANAPDPTHLAQGQVPAECAKLENPAERQKCMEEKGKQ